METMVEQFFALGADQARSKFEAMCQVSFKKFEACAPPAQMPGKGGGRRNSEDEQEQDKASQQFALSASSGSNEGTPASSSELDLPRLRGALGECGGKSGTCNGERVEGTLCKKEKEKRNSQGRDPRTFDENNQRCRVQKKRCRVQKKRKEKKWKKKKKKKDRKKKAKYRRSSWWTKAKGRIASLLAAKLKKEEQEKKGRKAGRVTNVPERDKSWASLEDC